MRTAVGFAEQILDGLACAHGKRIIHCDVKPENFILFSNNLLRLSDFGIARVAFRTVDASGSGTVGYLAPEQAMGRPSLRSDVFSAGLVLYRMFSGSLPEWPFERPHPGMDRLKRNTSPRFISFLVRALEVKPARRFKDAGHMLESFRVLKRKWKVPAARGTCKRCGWGQVNASWDYCPWCGKSMRRR